MTINKILLPLAFGLVLVMAITVSVAGETTPATLQDILYNETTLRLRNETLTIVDDRKRGVVCYIRSESRTSPSCVKYRTTPHG